MITLLTAGLLIQHIRRQPGGTLYNLQGMGQVTLLDPDTYAGRDDRLNQVDVVDRSLYPLVFQHGLQDLCLRESQNS